MREQRLARSGGMGVRSKPMDEAGRENKQIVQTSSMGALRPPMPPASRRLAADIKGEALD